MSSSVEAPPVVTSCAACGRQGGGLRKGLCRACYLRAWRGAELPPSAACVVCPERRRMVLRWTRLGASDGETTRVITCQNCGFLADKLRPRALSVEGLRERLGRERRLSRERRSNYVMCADETERRQKLRRGRRRLPV